MEKQSFLGKAFAKAASFLKRKKVAIIGSESKETIKLKKQEAAIPFTSVKASNFFGSMGNSQIGFNYKKKPCSRNKKSNRISMKKRLKIKHKRAA
jgi:hypothetical protein